MSAELEKGLYSILSGNSPQTLAGSRIYPRLPQGVTFPAIRYQRITATRRQAIDSNVGVTEVYMQLDLIAESYSEAKSLADEVRTILHGYRGAFGTLVARNVVLDSEQDEYDEDGDRLTHRVMQRYRIYTNMD